MDAIIVKKKYNEYRNRIRYELSKFRNKLYNNYLKELNIKNGTLWNALRFDKLSNGMKINDKNKIHGPNGITYNKTDIANIFADCFENVHNLT